jgi:hypothetical protein
LRSGLGFAFAASGDGEQHSSGSERDKAAHPNGF